MCVPVDLGGSQLDLLVVALGQGGLDPPLPLAANRSNTAIQRQAV